MPGTRFQLEVNPEIPARLARLDELANNLWYSWDRPTRSLFARLGGKDRFAARVVRQTLGSAHAGGRDPCTGLPMVPSGAKAVILSLASTMAILREGPLA